MDGDEITELVDLLHVCHMFDAAVQVPGRVYGNIGVIAVDFHAQVDGRVGHTDADGAQADDAQLLAPDLGTRELFLLLFRHFGDIGILPVGPDPVHAFHNVTGSQQHAREDQLLDAVGVGAGRIEDDNTFLGASVQGDVVDARARPGNGQQIV